MNLNSQKLSMDDLLSISGGKKNQDYLIPGTLIGSAYGASLGAFCLAISGTVGLISLKKSKIPVNTINYRKVALISLVTLFVPSAICGLIGAHIGTWWDKLDIPTTDNRTVLDFGKDGAKIGLEIGGVIATFIGITSAFLCNMDNSFSSSGTSSLFENKTIDSGTKTIQNSAERTTLMDRSTIFAKSALALSIFMVSIVSIAGLAGFGYGMDYSEEYYRKDI